MVINQAIEATGLMQTQRLATLFDGITRHSPEGIAFKDRVETMGRHQAVQERDLGTFAGPKIAPSTRRNRRPKRHAS
jgi:enoyl-CoA hydratase